MGSLTPKPIIQQQQQKLISKVEKGKKLITKKEEDWVRKNK